MITLEDLYYGNKRSPCENKPVGSTAPNEPPTEETTKPESIITDFSHNSIPDACTVLQYGEFIDMTLYGGTAEDSYYRGYSHEAIGKGDWFGTADQIAERITSGFRKSAGHWSYVGSPQYPCIAVGVIHAENKWYVGICMSAENYGG